MLPLLKRNSKINVLKKPHSAYENAVVRPEGQAHRESRILTHEIIKAGGHEWLSNQNCPLPWLRSVRGEPTLIADSVNFMFVRHSRPPAASTRALRCSACIPAKDRAERSIGFCLRSPMIGRSTRLISPAAASPIPRPQCATGMLRIDRKS